jgi:hypothetical protein
MASRLETLRGQVDPILTQFAIGYKSADLIAEQVCPVVDVYVDGGTIVTFGKEGFYLYDTERALRANAKKADFVVGKDTYQVAENAFETSLDYDELDAATSVGADAVMKLEQRSVQFTQLALARRLEYTVANIVLSGTYYASGNKVTLTGDDKWSSANSDPLGQIKTGIKAARADMGIEPNTLVLGYDAYWELAAHAQIKAMFSDNKDKEIVLRAEDIAALLRLQRVIVGKSNYSTDAGVFTDLWTDSAALIYLPPPAELVEGTTPHTVIFRRAGYPIVRTYNEKKVRSYETTRKHQVKNISTSNGYLIEDCA